MNLPTVRERLTVRRKKRKRLVLDRIAEPRLKGPNQACAMNFIVAGLATGRMMRISSVVDTTRASVWSQERITVMAPAA